MTKSKTGVPFKLKAISTEQFATFKENHQSDNPTFDIDFSVDVKASLTQKMIGVLSKFVFMQNNAPVIVLECGCHFLLSDEYLEENVTDNDLLLNKALLTHLLVLTVGTSRGVLHAKKPKWLDTLFLPTFNVSESFEGDITIHVTEDDEEE